jgi:23S rRNA maturation mini-RNase III
MEVLFGYLHITCRQERLRELFALAYANTEE